MMGLTASQRDCLVFLRSYLRENGIAPSMSEIGQALGFKSKATVHRLLDGLEDRGYITRLHQRTRSIQVLKAQDHHTGDCACADCDRHTRYIAQLKLVQGLKVQPPVAVLRARHDNFRPLSISTRCQLLGEASRDGLPSKVG